LTTPKTVERNPGDALAPCVPLADLDALFLDVGNTLISMDFVLIAEILARRGVTTSAEKLARAEAAARPHLSRYLLEGTSTEGKDTFHFHVGRVLAGLDGLSAVDVDALAADAAHDIKQISTQRLWSAVLPGIPEALAELRAAGVKLIAVSNSDGTVEDGLVAAGLRPLLDGVIDSARVGVEKPDPRIFHIALELSGSAPERTAHVGDLYAADVLGARAAGLHAILVDPYGDWDGVLCDRTADLPTLASRVVEARERA
jgi:putative hydrolase of the HAD superfamily